MKSKDFTKSKSIFSLENINHDITQVLSSVKFGSKEPNFDIKLGIMKIIADKDPSFDYFINNVNNIIQLYLHTTVYDTFPKNCPKCGNTAIYPYDTYDKSIKDMVGIVEIKIQRYMCRNCGGTFLSMKKMI